MRKFLMSATLALVLLLSESSAYATPVQIYDSDFNNLLYSLKLGYQSLNVELWGTEYYTYQGARRCELHFGNSKSNIIRFRLNNDNSVSRVLITTSYKYMDDNADEVSYIVSGILTEIGLNLSEIEILTSNLENNLDQISPYAIHFHEKSSVWCSKTRRYITLDLEIDLLKADFYIYASI